MPQISTHTSRVGCDYHKGDTAPLQEISTHTSRVGCDTTVGKIGNVKAISTHTSRVGCDLNAPATVTSAITFLLTHPVWDVTTIPEVSSAVSEAFLLTHPVWDVTMLSKVWLTLSTFLLTHPVWDVTLHHFDGAWLYCDFYSHIPCGM